MFLFCSDEHYSADADPTEAAQKRAARRVRALQDMTELAVEATRMLVEGAADQPAAERDGPGLSLALSRLGRFVRLNLALEAKLDGRAPVREPEPRARVIAQPEPRPADDPAEPPTYAEIMRRRGLARRRMIRDRVACLIENEAREKGDGYESERLLGELHVKLVEVEDVTEFASPPVAEKVFNLCRDLGVKFDESVFVDKDWWTIPPAGGPWANPFAPAPGVNRERWSRPPDPGDAQSP